MATKQTIEAHELAKIISGKKVRDKVTGIEGQAKIIRYYLYGCAMVGVCYNSGLIGETTKSFPVSGLLILDDDNGLNLSEIEVTCDDQGILGKLCRDKVSGFKGVADEMIIIHGSQSQVVLQPKAQEDNSKLPERVGFDLPRIEIIEEVVKPNKVQEEGRHGGVYDRAMYCRENYEV